MKVGIVTINDNNNYGNRLQNYAVQEVLKKNKCDVYTIKNLPQFNNRKNLYVNYLKYYLKKIIKKIMHINSFDEKRLACFNKFNENIKFTENYVSPYTKISNEYDYFITGSDQVWNPNFSRFSEVDLLNFANCNQRIAFAASFGISNLERKYHDIGKRELAKFKAISVREQAGKNIVENLTYRDDIEVLVDPTMLLTSEEWDKVSKKPEQLKTTKYILNYFLGELSDERKKEIDRIAKENSCEIINILDKNSPYYRTGPSEFLYLEKNAFLICTDSFHSCVFSILYNRPFIVFEREDRTVSMNSRIETLLEKFQLRNRKFDKKITEENLHHDYTKAYAILEVEREKSIDFLKKALDIKK